MKIAFFSKHLPSDEPNGVSVQVHRLANALVARGHDLTCFSMSSAPENARYTCVQLAWGSRTRLKMKFRPAMAFRGMAKSEFDIRHYHGDDYLCRGGADRFRTFYGSAGFEALHAARPGRFFYQAFFYSLEWASCFRSGTLAGISATTRRALPLVNNIIGCGVPLESFVPDPAAKTSYPSLLFIGDFRSRKQGDRLLKAFVETVHVALPQSVLTVVGPERIDGAGVRCLGRISEQELIREYQKAWIYCMPSSYEGFGVPAIEAMACKTAVVAVSNRGTREIIMHDENGILCDIGAMGGTLVELLTDKGRRGRITEEGMKTVKMFDVNEIARKYEKLYEKAVLAAEKKVLL